MDTISFQMSVTTRRSLPQSHHAERLRFQPVGVGSEGGTAHSRVTRFQIARRGPDFEVLAEHTRARLIPSTVEN